MEPNYFDPVPDTAVLNESADEPFSPDDAETPYIDEQEPEVADEQPEQPEQPQADWQAEKAQYEEQLRTERTRNQGYENQRQQALFQQAAQAFEQEWKREVEVARTLDYDQAVAHLDKVRQQREAQLLHVGQQAVQRTTIGGYTDHVLREFNLSPEDKAFLGDDPTKFIERAQALKARDDRLTQLSQSTDKQIKNLRRGQQAQQLIASGATRAGGSGQRAPVTNPGELPLNQQLQALLSGRVKDGY